MADRDTRPLTPPADPWAGSAEVVPTAMMPAEPYVIVVERPRKRRWPWVLGGLAVVSVLCCVGAVAVWTPIGKEYPAQLVVEDSHVAGLTRENTPEFRTAAAELVADIHRDYDVDDAVAAMLTDKAVSGRSVILIAATKLILNPAGEMSGAIESTSQSPPRDVTRYPDLGGHPTCANGEDDTDTAVVICAWIDHGSLGVGIFYGPWEMAACARTLSEIRTAIIRRGR